ncbi:MAG: hypothetical protein K6G15_08040 [Desulfovibrio sp.]|nr:hypothetical protein [Desulfovibrio sp.]
MPESPALPQSVLDAFHLMWDSFPEPVQLTHKSRKILAVNKAAARFGLSPGLFCNQLGKPEQHKGCKANLCLSTGTPQYVSVQKEQREVIAFWLPIEGFEDFFVHFGVGYSLNYQTGEKIVP